MARVVIPITGVDEESRSQLEYALTFASEEIVSYRINDPDLTIEVEVSTDAACEPVRRKIQELVGRYEKREFGVPKTIQFKQERDLPIIDAWSGLMERKWVTPVGQGHVILRGMAAQLLSLIDAKVDGTFARFFEAEREFYPATILCKTLDRIHHFTSFPEHVDFVAHLKGDLDVLNTFSNACREQGWSAALHEGRMGENDFAICPSCCYHCYEGMENWQLEFPGRCTTMVVPCHRYEGANHRTMSRLRAFTMPEVVWIGHPRFVMEGRAKAEELIVQWAKDWELVGSFETANDMFFTQDYSVKASFQRQQEAKRELRLLIPAEKQSISVFSSNFHGMTFAKAFNITVGGRHATSACVGWGYERWVYAIFSQFGFDVNEWPSGLKEEFADHRAHKAKWKRLPSKS
jgi:seryl-tRNA synthetase